MIPSSIKEVASSGLLMMFCMHLANTRYTHVKCLNKKLCIMSSPGAFQFCALFKTLDILEAVMLVASISEVPDIRCYSSFNHIASKLLFLFYPKYLINNELYLRLEEPQPVRLVIVLCSIHGRTASHFLRWTCFSPFSH